MIGKFVVIDTLDNFKTKLSQIPSSAIVLIKDVGQIYAHGTYFGAQKIYNILTKTASGLAPMGGTSADGQIKSKDSEWVLTVTNGENPSWRRLPDNAFNNEMYTLPAAGLNNLGGIKVGYVNTTTFNNLSGDYYKVNIDKDGLAYVNVPKNIYTASNNGISLSDSNVFTLALNSNTKLDKVIGDKVYAVSLDKNGKLCTSVPWSDTNNYRPISVDGTSILENDNTILNLVSGSNITITPEKNSSNKYTGKVTINASDKASLLQYKSVIPFSKDTKEKWYKFARCNQLGRYSGVWANFILSTSTISSTSSAYSQCNLHFNAYQQHTLGNPPIYGILWDSDQSAIEIVAVLTYNTEGYTFEFYAKSKSDYVGLSISQINGSKVILINSEAVDTLPSGTQIIPEYYKKVKYSVNSEYSTTATNINGGTTGSIPFQTAAGTTSFIGAASTNDYILRYSTTNKKPYWTAEKNDNDSVKQTNTTTLDEDFRVLLSYSASDTTLTEGARKSSKLKFNPVTGTLTSTILKGNLDGSYIDKLTGYTVSQQEASISASDSLINALGKLEYKLNSTYTWYKGVIGTDEDTVINKWDEIVDFVKNVSEGTDLVDEFVTRKTAQTITGLKTFQSESRATGVSLILKNNGWTGGMSTAMDFYNGSAYKVPNARIETKMVGSGNAGGTLIFYTQTKHDSTNPNSNGLTERLRIDDQGTITASTDLVVNKNITGAKLITIGGTSSQFLKGDGTLDSNLYYSVKGQKYNADQAWDWNDITEAGTYKIQTGSSIANHPKRDDTNASYPYGLALVIHGIKNDSEKRITQVYFPHDWVNYNDIPLYLRMRNGANLTWTSWAKIPSVDFVTKLCAKYLPLTGGTLDGQLIISNASWGTQLTINRSTGNGNSVIQYTNSDNGFLGCIGIAGEGSSNNDFHPIFNDKNKNEYRIYHSGNLTKLSQLTDDVVSGKYLPLTGGTLTGNLTLYTASGDSPQLLFQRNNIGSDTSVDWRFYVTSGHLMIQNALSSFNSGSWATVLKLGADQANKTLNTYYNIEPSSDKALSLGSSTIRWSNIYTIDQYVGRIIIQSTNGIVHGIASSWTDCAKDENGTDRPWYGLTWGTDYPSGSNPNHNQMILSNYYGMTFRTGSAGHNIVFKGGNVRPYANTTQTLGTSSYRWSNFYSSAGNFSGIVTMGSRLRMVGTSETPAWDNAGAITWTENGQDKQPVSLVYTSYDTYRAPAGLVLLGSQGSEWFEVKGNIYGNGFVKSSSSDSYVLLGGGGHKTISDLLLKSELTTIEKTLNVTADWMDTGIAGDNIPSNGSYIVQVSVKANDSTGDMWNCYWSGVMTWYVTGNNAKTNDTETDEILLHRSGHAYQNTIYLRTILTSGGANSQGVKLQIAANKNIGKEYKYTFKSKRII